MPAVEWTVLLRCLEPELNEIFKGIDIWHNDSSHCDCWNAMIKWMNRFKLLIS